MVRKKQVYVKLSKPVVDEIEKMADYGAMGNSKSEVIRTIIVAHLTDCLDLLDLKKEGNKGNEEEL